MSAAGQTVQNTSNATTGTTNRECVTIPCIVVQAIPQAFSLIWKTTPDTPFWIPKPEIGANEAEQLELVNAMHIAADDPKSSIVDVNINAQWFNQQPFITKEPVEEQKQDAPPTS